MIINRYDGYEAMSSAVAEFTAEQIRKKPDSLLCVPSGDTPTGFLTKLIEKKNAGELSFARSKFVGLDEWVGMDKEDVGSCKHYVYNQFFYPAGIQENQVAFFNAKSDNLTDECRKIDNYIFANGPIDLVIVGVGVNGHIGLNEPGVSPGNYCHVVDLEESTIRVAQKYFDDSTRLEKGITLGLQHIMDAKTVVVIANGLRKAPVIAKIIEGARTENIPGTILQLHKNCYFFLDRDAASELK